MTVDYRETLARLQGAQKDAARGAPAYSRFVNRRLGRYLAAWAHGRGLTPNQVTAVSAFFTFTGIALLAVLQPTWWLGLVVGGCFILGYAFDSADGQVARLTGTGSPAGEWLDHVVDATKIAMQPLALAVGVFRFDVLPTWWLLVPLVNAVTGSVLFFSMILTEQIRRAHGRTSRAPVGGRAPWIRPLLALPTDYGILCLSFLFLGATSIFATVYTALTLATTIFLLIALRKWFREMQTFQPARP